MRSNRLKKMAGRTISALLALLVLTGCYGMARAHLSEYKQMRGTNPPLVLTLAPTYTPAVKAAEAAEAAAAAEAAPPPTETATASPTSLPTATATATRPAPTAISRVRPTATAIPKATPIVVIPNGFTKQTDSLRGYSLALPRGYTLLDLRSAQFRNLAGAVGMGAQLAPLNEFLDSDAGQIVGILAASDLTGMIFGGLPTIAQVMVVNAKGASQETAQVAVESILTGQGGFLSNPVIGTMENATINNLPGVRATVTGNLAGANRPMAGKVVGLLANDKLFVLIQLTQATKLAAKESIFDQIIGTFRPE